MPNEIRPIDAVALKNDICGAMQQIEAIAYMGLRNDVSRMSQAINAAIDAAPTLDYALVSRWISVKERLPEKKQRVMVYTTQGVYRLGAFSFVGKEGAVWFKCDKSCISCTHWMPLPPAPEEGIT